MSEHHQSERFGWRSDHSFRRLVWLAVALCGTLVAVEIGWNLRVSLDMESTDGRLAPTVAMLHGIPLWPRFGEGPLLDMIYGPVAALTWVPAALQSTPTRALTVGLIEAFLLTLLPVAWIVRTEARHYPTVFASTMLLGLAYLVSTPVLPGLGVNVDVPALGFGTIALACAWTEGRRQHAGWRWAGAAAVVAAVGSKQVMVPLLVAYPAWIALASGRRTAVQTLLAITMVGAAALLLVVLTVDVNAMLATTIVQLSRHPWQASDPVEALSTAVVDLLRRAMPAAFLLAIAAALLRRRAATWQALAQSNRWLFPLVVAIACIPTAVLGRVKVGGSPNTLAPSISFVWLAMLAAYAMASHRGPVVRRTLTTVAVVVACVLAVRVAPKLEALPWLLRERPVPSVAFDAARDAPGTIYFPSRPTVALMAEGRADHSTAGIRYAELGGREVGDHYARVFLPPALERVASDARFFPYVLKYLPQFRRQILDPSLPGWAVLVRDDLLAPGERLGPPATYREPRMALPTQALTEPDARASLLVARVLLPERGRRHRVRLEATVASSTAHVSLDVDVLLRDEAGRHLLSLAARATTDARGSLAVEWPAFDEVLWSMADALVLIRGGQPVEGEPWRLSPEHARSLVRGSHR